MVSRPDTPTSGISTSSSRKSSSKLRDRGGGDGGGRGGDDIDVDEAENEEEDEKPPVESAPCLSAGGDYSACMMPPNVNIPPGTKVTKGDLDLFRFVFMPSQD